MLKIYDWDLILERSLHKSKFLKSDVKNDEMIKKELLVAN